MYPNIFKIGWFELRSYGLLLMVAFLIGIFLTKRYAVKKGIKGETVLDMSVIIVISSLIGSRFLYVIFHLNEFRGKWLDIINPFHGEGSFGIAGLSMMGGIVFAVVSC
ncbi:prolipoprotein diacylglyceryl transferase family protein, partial [candidate division KSB1 bacterium]